MWHGESKLQSAEGAPEDVSFRECLDVLHCGVSGFNQSAKRGGMLTMKGLVLDVPS